MEEEFPSDEQLKFLREKVKCNDKFTRGGLDLVIKNMETYEEYSAARAFLGGVSRSEHHHSREYVAAMAANPLYYPFVVTLKAESGESPKVVGFFEVYLLPHLGRWFDSRLERVIVEPAYRNHGIFGHIVAFVIDFCKLTVKCNRVDLTCQNPVAQRVYENLGFEKVNTHMYRKYL